MAAPVEPVSNTESCSLAFAAITIRTTLGRVGFLLASLKALARPNRLVFVKLASLSFCWFLTGVHWGPSLTTSLGEQGGGHFRSKPFDSFGKSKSPPQWTWPQTGRFLVGLPPPHFLKVGQVCQFQITWDVIQSTRGPSLEPFDPFSTPPEASVSSFVVWFI